MDHFDHLSRSSPAEAPGHDRDQLAASGCPGQIITHLVIWHSSCKPVYVVCSTVIPQEGLAHGQARENPKKDIISFRIDDLELEILQQRAAASDISLSQLLRQSLDLPCTRFDDNTQQAA